MDGREKRIETNGDAVKSVEQQESVNMFSFSNDLY